MNTPHQSKPPPPPAAHASRTLIGRAIKHYTRTQHTVWALRSIACRSRGYSGSVLLSDVPCAEHFAENPLEVPCCRTRRRCRAKSILRKREATQGRQAAPTAATRTRAPPAPATAPDGNRSDPEGARRRPTAPARSEAEPRTRTAARPPASAATSNQPVKGL